MTFSGRPIFSATCCLLLGLMAPAMAHASPFTDSSELRQAVTLNGVRVHQLAFQSHADANGGHRADGSAGHQASVDYVTGLMSAAGYDVAVEEYSYPGFFELSPAIMAQILPTPAIYTYDDPAGFFTMAWSGSGNVTALTEGVDTASADSGCEANDFAGFTPGNIAVMKRGACAFALKVTNAEAAGAVAAIVYNDGTPGREDAIAGTLGSKVADIPSVGTSFSIGTELAGGGVLVQVMVDATYEQTSKNIIADSQSLFGNEIITIGAGLDSVAAGPGINDSGSGAATILEIALQLKEIGALPVNKLRFAFWGSSEANNRGSNHHLTSLGAEDFDAISTYLDFSIIGSPNFARFVYDGDSAPSAPPGSEQIEQMFLDYFANEAVDLPNEPFDELTGGYHSDLLTFALAGKPVGGLFTGTTGIKSAGQVSVYGGTAGDQYDPCNHFACDTADNTSIEVLDQMSDAAAHAIYLLAEDGRSVPVPAWSSKGMILAMLLMALFGFAHIRRKMNRRPL